MAKFQAGGQHHGLGSLGEGGLGEALGQEGQLPWWVVGLLKVSKPTRTFAPHLLNKLFEVYPILEPQDVVNLDVLSRMPYVPPPLYYIGF
jgi:hypothetical protein